MLLLEAVAEAQNVCFQGRMPILLILRFAAAAIEKAIIFTEVHFCLFNESEVPVS